MIVGDVHSTRANDGLRARDPVPVHPETADTFIAVIVCRLRKLTL